MHKPVKEMNFKPYNYSKEGIHRPYLKDAMDRINRDLKLPKDYHMDEILTDYMQS
jgi:hypothetical protein